MRLATEMTLPRIDFQDPAFQANPGPILAAARDQHPWLARYEEMFFVHGHKAIADLSIMDDKLVPAFDGVVQHYGVDGTPWGRFMEANLLALSGEHHRRIRNTVANVFTPRSVNAFRGVMRENIKGLLDDWAPKGQFDFAEFAANFPISVFCAMLGTSAADILAIRRALETQSLVLTMNRDLLPGLLAGFDVMSRYIDDLIAEREQSAGEGGEGFLDTLLKLVHTGQLGGDELRSLLIILFNAGYDTSKNMLTLIMHTMLSHPDHWARCAQDMEFCESVVEEMFRHTSTAAVLRKVAQEFDYDGVHFPAGSMLFYGNMFAGRDPRVFSNPEEFDPERVHNTRHVAFGRGAHMCIGQHLARAQIAEGTHEIAKRITKPRLVGDILWRKGIRALPIEFVPGHADA